MQHNSVNVCVNACGNAHLTEWCCLRSKLDRINSANGIEDHWSKRTYHTNKSVRSYFLLRFVRRRSHLRHKQTIKASSSDKKMLRNSFCFHGQRRECFFDCSHFVRNWRFVRIFLRSFVFLKSPGNISHF